MDPFSMVYTALWTLAESYEDLMRLVKLGNRIRYDSKYRDPEKRTGVVADYPELTLVSEGLTGNLHATSSSGFTLRNYAWYITTGDMRITELMLPVEFELFRAMSGWKEVLSPLKWKDKTFVKRANITNVTNGIVRPNDRTDGPLGWAAIWSIEVEMHFATEDLK